LSIRSLFLVASILSPGAALAQDASEDVHSAWGTDIIVTAPFERERFALTTAASVLESEALTREVRGTIGETLARQPGVTATFFGPNASRPILRGFDGERVRILTDGIGSFDVSNTSVDHAVAINPLNATRIEVIRGPASLLYGSGAIGGVVNVTDRRIAREIPEEFAHIDAIGTLASVNDERSISGSIDVPVGKTGLVVHADGSYLKTGDYRAGGYVFSRDVREAAEAIGGEVAEDSEKRGRVDNSDAETWEVAGGVSWIGDRGNMGISVSRLGSNYGIPPTLSLDDDNLSADGISREMGGKGGAEIRLDMRQTRIDARAEAIVGGNLIESVKFRFGWADYVHDEVEPNGDIGTTFTSNALEARVEAVQTERDGWKGATGAQILSRRFEASGEEAYIPLNQTDQLGLFTLQSFDMGGYGLEFGARYEHTNVSSAPLGIRRSFDAFSGSVGASVALGEAFRLSGSIAYTERAPAAEELFVNGAHAATNAFEIGNPDFDKERSLGTEAVLRGRGEGWRLELSGFFNRFYDFIYLAPTGLKQDNLPVFLYTQGDSRFWGFEAEGAVTIARFGDTAIDVTGLADFVRADLLGGQGRVPRIPSLRFIGGLEANGGAFGGRVEVEHVTRADRVATFETETPAYTLVNASAAWRPFGDANPTALILSVNNIFDVDARRHTSFLKDFAPLPGRDVRLTARFSF
jgi:iron complex outermembrane receptor protein